MKRIICCVLTILLFAGASAAQAADNAVSDDVIYDQVSLKLTSDTTVNGGAIEVHVKQGAVTLSGKVKTEKAKDKAGKSGDPILDKLGESEVKPSKPTVNPLDKGTDDLLKDLK